MNQQQKTILAGVIILIVGIGLGFLVSRTGSHQNSSAVTSTIATSTQATSTPPIDTSDWKTYSNYELGFSFKYPADLALNTSLQVQGQDAPASLTLAFPTNDYFTTVLKDEATFAIYTQPTCPTAVSGGLPGVNPQNVTINGVNFTMSTVDDAAVGNLYKTIAYDVNMNSVCYRILLYVHGANGAALYLGDDQAAIQKADAQHAVELQHVIDVFNKMLSTFTFISTPAGENEADYDPAAPSQVNDFNQAQGNNQDRVSGFQVQLNTVSPSSASIGDTVNLSGSGFSGHDAIVWISDGNTQGVLWGGMPTSDTNISAQIPSQACTQYTGASGMTCPSYLILRPGVYTVDITNQNGTSNQLYLTVK